MDVLSEVSMGLSDITWAGYSLSCMVVKDGKYIVSIQSLHGWTGVVKKLDGSKLAPFIRTSFMFQPMFGSGRA